MDRDDAGFLIIVGTIILSIVLGVKYNGFIGWGFLGSVCLISGSIYYMLSWLDNRK